MHRDVGAGQKLALLEVVAIDRKGNLAGLDAADVEEGVALGCRAVGRDRLALGLAPARKARNPWRTASMRVSNPRRSPSARGRPLAARTSPPGFPLSPGPVGLAESRSEPPWVGNCSTSNTRRPFAPNTFSTASSDRYEIVFVVDRVELDLLDQAQEVRELERCDAFGFSSMAKPPTKSFMSGTCASTLLAAIRSARIAARSAGSVAVFGRRRGPRWERSRLAQPRPCWRWARCPAPACP